MQGFDKIPPVVLEMWYSETQKRLLVGTFVDGPEPFSGMHNYTNREKSQASFNKNPTSGLRGDAITRLLQFWVKGK